jgi:hypothetical protein
MEIKDVTGFIEANKTNPDVQNFIKGFITPESVTAFLSTDDGKKLLQPQLDSYHAKGLESFKKTSLPKLIDEEVTKRHPGETEEQKRIRKIEQDNQTLQKEISKGKMKDSLISKAKADSLPVELLDFLIADDETTTTANYTKVLTAINSIIDKKVQEIFKNNGITPPDKNHQKKKYDMNSFIRGGTQA